MLLWISPELPVYLPLHFEVRRAGMIRKPLRLHFFEDHAGPLDLRYYLIVIVYKHSVPMALNCGS